MVKVDSWVDHPDWPDILDGIVQEIERRVQASGYHETVVESVKTYRDFQIMKDGWEFNTIVKIVNGKKSRMTGFLPSEEFFNPRRVEIIMSGYWEHLLYMQSDAWAEWVRKRDEIRE
jgi:hypothetical protein